MKGRVTRAEAKAKPSASTSAKKKRPGSLWESLGSGENKIRVLRGFTKVACQKNKSKRRPEIAILELSEKAHAEFQKDPVGFVNKVGIFSCPVRGVERLVRAEQSLKTLNPGAQTRLTINHEPDCVSYYY